MLQMNYGFKEWGSAYSVGDKVLDCQRQSILTQFDELLKALKNHDNPQVADRLSVNLLYCLRIHFTAEEKIMGKISALSLEDHLQDHKFLLNEAENISYRIACNIDSDSCSDSAHFLKNLVVGHFTLSDISLREHLWQKKQNGREREIPIGGSRPLGWLH